MLGTNGGEGRRQRSGQVDKTGAEGARQLLNAVSIESNRDLSRAKEPY